jgi:hypothetical protein
VKREVDVGSLLVRSLTDVNWHRPLGIIHRRNKSMTAPAEKFVELLHEDPLNFKTNTSSTSVQREPAVAASHH